MQEARKSLLAATGVVVVIGAAIFGGLLRNRMEVGPGVVVGGPITMESLVSSTNGIPDPSEAAKNPISESTFFYHLTLLLEKEFVDGVEDESGLATGAIRAMVNSLADSYSSFYKPEQMRALVNRRAGVFEGIGIELKLAYDEEQLRLLQDESIGATGPDSNAQYDPVLLFPTIVVTAVAPASPADKAGIQAGDRIKGVNGKWALSSEEVDEIRSLRTKFDSGELTDTEFQEAAARFRERYESSIPPSRVMDLLLLGTTGSVDLVWKSSGGDQKSEKIQKRRTTVEPVVAENGVYRLRFFNNAPDAASNQLPQQGPLTLDLRQSTMGDFDAMKQCLAALVPDGRYGSITREQAGAARSLSIAGSTAAPREITLLVDDSTWGAAAVFAHALVASGHAKLGQGSLPTKTPWIELVSLPDGSGYTLRTGTFVSEVRP